MAGASTDPGPPREGQATVILTQHVKTGRDDEFRQWQDAVNRAVGAFAGFLGTEVVAPKAGSGDWTVVYRFDSLRHLQAWLGSAERNDLLGRGADLFASPPSQQVVVGEPEVGLVTVVISHPVEPADEDEFLDWQRRFTDAERRFQGFRGAELFPPVAGIQENWTAIYRFDTEAHLNDWLDSPDRKQLLEEGEHFHDFELHRVSSPFGNWFAFGTGVSNAVPDWKSALSVLVGLYPTVVLLTLGISEIWPHGDLWVTLLVGNVLSVSLLTWVMMPIVNRALRFWLSPAPGTMTRRVDLIGAAASIGFLTLAALVFWLATTQIWTLP